ncbi:MAG: phosphoenolpyruvate synthase [Spirulina sp. DLM2.Bin59]|nr:MAG: phosphoenolpyruvate synthase [Spirulina sp. DLM2.Bin59]
MNTENPQTSLTRSLNALNSHDLPIAGGKGISLGAMLGAGLPVPGGFAVLTQAYQDFVTHNSLAEPVRQLVEDVPADDPATLAAAAQTLKDRFLAGTIPPHVAGAIATAYADIGSGLVVVRSSATAEDLPGASFAGQHDSFLNVEGLEDLANALRGCWASLWNPRAVSYRKRVGLDRINIAIAVVVQRMIDAERSGVLFTANPLDHRRDRMLLSASFGLGEAVVGGDVSPDHWVLDAAGQVLDYHCSDKQVITLREGKGTVNRPMPEDKRRAISLSDAEVAELAALGTRAQAHFNSPQDLEWAMQDGRIYLVQSRPITSLFPLPEPLPAPEDGLRLYLCFNVHAQQMLEPFTPAGIDWWRAIVGGFAHAVTGRPERDLPWLKEGAGRLFADITELLRRPGRWRQLAEAASDKDPITGQALLAFGNREGDRIIGRGGGIGFWWRLGPLLAWLAWWGLRAALNPELTRLRVLAKTDSAIRQIETEAKHLPTMGARVDFIRDVLGRRGAIIWIIPVAVMNPGLMAEAALRRKVRDWLGDENLITPVQRALPHNITTEMGLTLWRLARQFKAEGATPTANHPDVVAFLDRFGHRALWEIDPGIARWSEDPTYVLDLIRSYMDAPEDSDPEAQFHRQRSEAEAAAVDLVAQVRAARGGIQARIFSWQLRCYRQLAGLREQPKFEGARMIALARRIWLDAGAELVAKHALEAAEDVLFLRFDDLLAWEAGQAGDLRAKASEARANYELEKSRRAVPRWMTSDGEAIFGVKAEDSEGLLAGLPVSAGIYEGQVRVILHPADADLKRGEVLVCRGTDPAWTPLFLQAGALVMETGGAVSHGSIVAREYGLPAVAGVAAATTRLQDGQRVRVDGQSGQVVLLDAVAAQSASR